MKMMNQGDLNTRAVKLYINMTPSTPTHTEKKNFWSLPRKFLESISSIYGQTVIIIALLALVLFIAFLFIFRNFNRHYLEGALQQNGDNVVMLVEGALYEHMLENNRAGLRHTMNIIRQMPGIEDLNMYDAQNNLAHSSSHAGNDHYHNPNCKDCHDNLDDMFPGIEKSSRIISVDNECEMCDQDQAHRMLMIKSPILNEPACYTSACHAHQESEELLGSLIIRIPLNELDASVQKSLFLAGFITLLLVASLLLFTWRRIKRPLTNIIQASEAVAIGDREVRLETPPNQLCDLRMVSNAFNKMLDNLQAAADELENWSQQLEYKVQKKSEEISEIQNELIHIERIASLGKLSSSVAHEINNPLSGVLTYTKLVHKHMRKLELDDEEKESMLRYLKVIEDETKRCGDIVKGLLEFSRSDRVDFKPFHVHRLLKETYTLIEHQMKIENILFQTDFSATKDIILCNGNQIKQAGIAVLMNASDAILENGIILIKTRNPDDAHIIIEITDNGAGIARDDIPQIFEPFFSTKEKASGIGLGLAIVHGIVQNHNGKIHVDSELGKGTTVSIQLPLAKSSDLNKKPQ
jgi:two-component system NtrC family sensor kinase